MNRRSRGKRSASIAFPFWPDRYTAGAFPDPSNVPSRLAVKSELVPRDTAVKLVAPSPEAGYRISIIRPAPIVFVPSLWPACHCPAPHPHRFVAYRSGSKNHSRLHASLRIWEYRPPWARPRS
ncbi:MAG: hypothetical protein M3Z36_07125, partial [Acidobacteriota bacterium]|nr:hypothetical protein [Acidobacteriota bacterium]